MKAILKHSVKALGRPAVLIPVVIGLLGCLTIFNASCHTSRPYHFVVLQSAWLLLGVLLLIICTRYPIEQLLRWAPLFCFALQGLLYASILFAPLWAASVRGTISLVPGGAFFLEPAELLKPIYVLALARYAPAQEDDEPVEWRRFMVYFLLGLSWWVPLALIPNPGLLVLYVLVFALLYWLQGGAGKHLLAGLIAIAAMLALLYWLNPGLRAELLARIAGDDAWVSRSALSNAGLSGADAGKANWGQTYLSPKHPNLAMLSLAESLGFLGLLPVLAGVVVASYLGLNRSTKQQTLAEALVFAGVTAIFVFQILLHVSTVVGLFPSLHLHLPILGYGGSSLVASMAGIGLLIHFGLKREG